MKGTLNDKLGFVVCFSVGDRARLKLTIKKLKEIGAKHIRIYVSWHEWEFEVGRKWIKYFLKELIKAEFKILPDFTYTPAKYGINPLTNSPPRPDKIHLYGKFIDAVLNEFGDNFSEVELWNKPNLNTDWNHELDKTGSIFVDLIATGSAVARTRGKKVVLGGMNKIDMDWFEQVLDLGILKYIDVLGVHGLRGTWSEKIPPPSWNIRLSSLKRILIRYGAYIPTWITETGFPPIDLREVLDSDLLEKIQVVIFADAIRTLLNKKVQRLYWHSLLDLPPNKKSARMATTGQEDQLRYNFGCFNSAGEAKLLGSILQKYGLCGPYDFTNKKKLWQLANVKIERSSPL